MLSKAVLLKGLLSTSEPLSTYQKYLQSREAPAAAKPCTAPDKPDRAPISSCFTEEGPTPAELLATVLQLGPKQ